MMLWEDQRPKLDQSMKLSLNFLSALKLLDTIFQAVFAFSSVLVLSFGYSNWDLKQPCVGITYWVVWWQLNPQYKDHTIKASS